MADMYMALADIHGETKALERILNENSHLKGIFIAGDLTNFGGAKEAEKILSLFSLTVPNTALYFVAGNCDTEQARQYYEKRSGYIEQRCATLDHKNEEKTSGAIVRIIGCGGGLFHTGLTPFEVSDTILESNLRQAHERCLKAAKQGGAAHQDLSNSSACPTFPLIVLTHTPPKDSFADLRYTKHVGSPAFTALLYEYKPLLWICGHIHEGRSVQWEGKTLIVNPGPAAHGSYALFLLEKEPGGGLHAVAELRSL